MIFLKTITQWLFIFFVFLIVANPSITQAQVSEWQTWNDATLNYRFNDKLAHVGDLGARYYFKTNWSVLYIRPALNWHLSKNINVTGGVAAFFNSNPTIENITDLRAFGAVEFIWPRIQGFSFRHRVMGEQRWFVTDTNPTKRRFRGRYRLAFFTPRYHLLGEGKTFYNQLMIEFLDDLTKSNLLPFNRFQRYTFVMGYDFSKRAGLELHYQIHAVSTSGGVDIQQDIIRIRLKLNLNAS